MSATSSVKYRPFWIWLVGFYLVWLGVVWATQGVEAVTSHWPIAIAMALGSYVAGSTPMGGGTIGFPVLVLWFDQPAAIGRQFGLAIQSIGMVSASLLVLCSRQPLEWKLLKPALFGSLVGTPLGAALVAPWLPDLSIKLLFAVIWASFGLLHFYKLSTFVGFNGISDSWGEWDARIGWGLGLAGGIVSSVTGVGTDMLIYSTLMLLYRADMKIAIPTSVLLMAGTSVIGIASNLALAAAIPAWYPIPAEVFWNWLAAAPVVAVGAPLGAWVVARIPRTPTLFVVSGLCLAQFVWTCYQERVFGWSLWAALLGVAVMNLVFHWLFAVGLRRQRMRQAIQAAGELAESA